MKQCCIDSLCVANNVSGAVMLRTVWHVCYAVHIEQSEGIRIGMSQLHGPVEACCKHHLIIVYEPATQIASV